MSKRRNAHQRRMDRVRAAFDPADLIRICEMPQSGFIDYADRYDLPDQKGWKGATMESFYYYKNNGAPILFVAHLDSVQEDRTTNVVNTADGPLVLSGALDDRLGAYVGLELLPKLGIKTDILLTTNEEMGASTASDFFIEEGGKQYNWMIEFDRAGTDVVMYQYETKEMRDALKGIGVHVGMGSYSDIADLEQLGCIGFNWGVGYDEYHSRRSHAWLNDTFAMVSKFMRFYAAHASTFYGYEPVPTKYNYSSYGSYGSYGGRYATASLDDDDDVIVGEVIVDADEVRICPSCSEVELDAEGCCWECGYGVIHNNVTRKEA